MGSLKSIEQMKTWTKCKHCYVSYQELIMKRGASEQIMNRITKDLGDVPLNMAPPIFSDEQKQNVVH